MKRVSALAMLLFAGVLVTGGLLVPGCSPKPNQQEISKLDRQKAAAEAAEKKLAELRAERTKLEAELKAKQTQLQKTDADLQAGKNVATDTTRKK